MKTFLFTFVFVVLVLSGEFMFPSRQLELDRLLSPGMLVAARLPGGLAHNPLNIPIGLAVQAALIGGCVNLVRFLWSKAVDGQRSDGGS